MIGGKGLVFHVRVVVPSVAFQASCWLFLDLFYACPAVADGEPIGYGPVSSFDISERENEVGCLLTGGSSLDGLYPVHRHDRVFV